MGATESIYSSIAQPSLLVLVNSYHARSLLYVGSIFVPIKIMFLGFLFALPEMDDF